MVTQFMVPTMKTETSGAVMNVTFAMEDSLTMDHMVTLLPWNTLTSLDAGDQLLLNNTLKPVLLVPVVLADTRFLRQSEV